MNSLSKFPCSSPVSNLGRVARGAAVLLCAHEGAANYALREAVGGGRGAEDAGAARASLAVRVSNDLI